jgi:hypothetical protein
LFLLVRGAGGVRWFVVLSLLLLRPAMSFCCCGSGLCFFVCLFFAPCVCFSVLHKALLVCYLVCSPFFRGLFFPHSKYSLCLVGVG